MELGWVKEVRIDFDKREVSVAVDPAKSNTEALVQALERAGFENTKPR